MFQMFLVSYCRPSTNTRVFSRGCVKYSYAEIQEHSMIPTPTKTRLAQSLPSSYATIHHRILAPLTFLLALHLSHTLTHHRDHSTCLKLVNPQQSRVSYISPPGVLVRIGSRLSMDIFICTIPGPSHSSRNSIRLLLHLGCTPPRL